MVQAIVWGGLHQRHLQQVRWSPLWNACERHFHEPLRRCVRWASSGGEHSLREYICKPQNCTVSWAFAVTNAFDRLNNWFHFSSYKNIVEVALSAQELIDCVGKEHGVTGKVCDGLPLVWVPNPSTRTLSPSASSTTTPTRRRGVGSTSTTLLDTRSLLRTTSWVCSSWWWEDRDD